MSEIVLEVQDEQPIELTAVEGEIIRAISPVVTFQRIEGGATVTVQDVEGTKTVTVYDGLKGDTGDTPDFTIGTITTIEPDQPARATITGTAEAPVLNLWLPRGQTGQIENLYATGIPMSTSDSTSVYAAIDGKQAKEAGKGLSKNDFTDELKTKLDGVEAGATANVVSDRLDDTSTTNALSAAKGKKLAESKVDISRTYLVEKIGDQAHAIYTAGDYIYTDQGLYVAAVDIAPGTIISFGQLNPVHPKGAVNKLVDDIRGINDDIGSTPMGTTATTLTGAIAEHESDISAVESAIINTNNSVAGVQDGMAILADGDTHAAIAAGQFVYVKNHGTLAEGLYKATAAIGTNATLSTSNLTADGAGGLNDLQGQVNSLNSKITQKIYDETGTTDSTGNLIISASSPATLSNVIKAVPIRFVDGVYANWYQCAIGANSAFNGIVVHCFKADGTALANETVRVRLYYQ